MRFDRTPLAAIETLVRHSFKGDAKLFDTYHILSDTELNCVKDTVNKIKDCSEKLPIQLYSVNTNNKTIGYLVISKENKILYSFGLRKEFRTKEIKADWFNKIVLMMPDFKCYLWNKNTRAIEFLKRCGMATEKEEKNYTILNFKKGEI